MLIQRDKSRKDDRQHSLLQQKNKPFSVLSLGLLGKQNSIRQPHSRDISSLKNQTKNIQKRQERSKNTTINQNKENSDDFNIRQNASYPKSIENYHINLRDNQKGQQFKIQERITEMPLFYRFASLDNFSQELDIKKKNIDEKNKLGFCQQHQEAEESEKDRRVYVDMRKKIKKISKTKKEQYLSIFKKNYENDENSIEIVSPPLSNSAVLHKDLLERVFQDREVLSENCIFKNKVISQRIDNDVQTDDEQITAGIRRMTRMLSDAVTNKKNWLRDRNELLAEDNQNDHAF